MNRFGEIADELTELIEELDQPELAKEAAALKLALQRAFTKACLAERAYRHKCGETPRPALGPQRRRAQVADRPSTGVVIELPRAWRLSRTAARQED